MCNACPNTADIEAFGGQLLQIINNAGVAMMISIGHRTGLFDTMANLEPSTSESISEQAGLNKRYVREWLGAMVTGKMVTFDPETGYYHLPAEHAALLTRASGPDNMACTMQWISVLGNVEDKIVDCFRQGGGVPYSEYARFHQVMADESDNSVIAGLLDHILPLDDEMLQMLDAGIDVLDVGCGSGRAMCFLARRFPNSRFVGYDISEEGISAARETAAKGDLSNVAFDVLDVSKIDHVDDFDLITAFDSVHDQADPAGLLSCVNQALRPGGLFLMQDIAASSHVEQNIEQPLAPFLYTISCMHCMTVSLSAGGVGLGAVWGKELACEMLNAAGFNDVVVHKLPHDIINYFYLARTIDN